MIHRSAGRYLLAALCFTAVSIHARAAGAQTDLLPNLEPFPASDVQLVSGANGLELRFSTTSWNRGVGPVELIGCPILVPGTPENPGSQIVYQNIYRTDGSIRQETVGTFNTTAVRTGTFTSRTTPNTPCSRSACKAPSEKAPK